MNNELEVVERHYSYKMRVWDIFLGDDWIGVVKYNTESENISFKLEVDYVWSEVNYAVKAMNIVKSQLADEVLLGDI